MGEHTKGPWKAFVRGSTFAIMDNHHDEIIHWSGFDSATAKGAKSLDKKRANARLIAAAPDLLKELKKVVFDWDGEPEDMIGPREAIAKAEGK